ncbi:ECF transporter S component [Pelagibacterium sp.]|uniref:ECF transporter S component n=1 Tax=Pelagibacterium sp. TaxID=1967288 RepID=UPI003A8FE14F
MSQYVPATWRWTLRETLVVAVLGAAFAVLYLAWVQVWLVSQAVFGPVTMDVFMGFWFSASIVAAAIIRKPGVALMAEVLAAGIEILLGSPAGLGLLVASFIQGLGAELIFAALGWKHYRLPVLIAAGVGAAVASFVYTWFLYDYGALQPWLVGSMLAVRITSGALLAGVAGYLIVEALYRTGVLRGLRIDMERRGAGFAARAA